jgi:hypothetical protein
MRYYVCRLNTVVLSGPFFDPGNVLTPESFDLRIVSTSESFQPWECFDPGMETKVENRFELKAQVLPYILLFVRSLFLWKLCRFKTNALFLHKLILKIMKRYGSVIKVRPRKTRRIQTPACGSLAFGAQNHQGLQHSKLFHLLQRWLLVQLLRIYRHRLSGRYGKNGCRPRNTTLVDALRALPGTARNQGSG